MHAQGSESGGAPFSLEEAEAIYRKATNAVPESFEACFSYAFFSQKLNHYEHARPIYERALALARLSGSQADVAITLNNLGILYRDQNQMEDARQAYEEALKTYQVLAKKNPDRYQRDVERMQRMLKELTAQPAATK